MAVYLTREQVRNVDRRAIEEYGIPGAVLMENAGRNAAEEARRMLVDGSNLRSAAILCGGGNNAGDGYVIARHLRNWGLTVCVYAAVPLAKLTGDAALNANIWARMEGPVKPLETPEQIALAKTAWGRAGLIIDALLGTGFSGTLRPRMADILAAANAAGAENGVPILAIDLPSGLDCDSGIPANPTIRAETTVTFVAQKCGFRNSAAREYLGRVVVCDIGAPAELIRSIKVE